MIETNTDLYNYLINVFDITYTEIPDEVQSNLHNNEQANMVYLGNYFLRSYKEIYTFFTENLAILYESNFIIDKEVINILDFGSGTGGQIFGLLHALSIFYKDIKDINIYSIDGNSNALEIQQKIFDEYWSKKFNYSINLKFFIKEIDNGDSLYNHLIDTFDQKFDIIITSKALSELVNNDNQIYYHFLKAVENLLDQNGICLISDITCQVKNSDYIPSIINNNIIQYYRNTNLSKPNSLYIVIPICCFYHKHECNKPYCYTQNKINMKVLINNQISFITCKIDFKLFLKRGIVLKNLYNNVLSKNPNKETCFINNKLCYCNGNDNYFKRVFKDLQFKSSQFSLKNYKEHI